MQRLCDGLYGYDTVWSAKRIYFSPVEQLSVIFILWCRRRRCSWWSYWRKKISFWLQLTSSCRLWRKQDARGRRSLSGWETGCSAECLLYGQYEKLVAELREEDARGYKNYMRISPELFQELLERDQFQTTDQIGICYGCVTASTVIYGHLRSTTEEMKFLNMLKIAPRKKQNGGSVTVDAGTSWKITVMSMDPGRISHG